MMNRMKVSGRIDKLLFWILGCVFLAACSVNPATGERQFTALMSPAQEVRVGAQEHKKIIGQYGLYDNPDLAAYVQEVGRRVAVNTERPNVDYKFFVLDSPNVNAFALPGGYVYVTRGLLALANNEAEMAAVLGHEIGHITGRHSAERYSRAVLTSLGAAAISAAADSRGISQALGLGSELYIKSYSRSQENEADTLGLRYLERAGYDVTAMSDFLENLQAYTQLQNALSGRRGSGVLPYFSTHPPTTDRVQKTISQTDAFTPGGEIGREAYLRQIDGMIFGDSPQHGFVRGQAFIHPDIGFRFEVPEGYKLENRPSEVVALGPGGGVILFDMVSQSQAIDPQTYLSQVWMRGEKLQNLESVDVQSMPAATAAFPGRVNGQPVTIRVMAINWRPGSIARFQIAIPQSATPSLIENLKRATYSFRPLTAGEIADARPKRIEVTNAQSGMDAAGFANRMAFDEYPEAWFRILNGLRQDDNVTAGRAYKIITVP